MLSGLLVISKVVSLASGRLNAGRAWRMAPLYTACLQDGYCLGGLEIACGSQEVLPPFEEMPM